MISKRYFSFIAFAVLAFALFFASATTNVRAGELPATVKTKSVAVKYPPNVANSFRAVRIVFVIERYSSYQPLLQRNLIPVILPLTALEPECYVELSPPGDALFRVKDEPPNLSETINQDNRARRPRPEIVRRGNRNK